MFRFVGLLAAAACSIAVAAEARWPERPVRLIIAGPPGGALDAVSRPVAERLSVRLGQPFIAEHTPGASGMIAADALLRAPADGHTLLVAPSGLATEVPHMLKMRFDPLHDLKPVAELGRSTLVLVGNRSFPARDLEALLRQAKASPGGLAYASYGNGTLSHVSGLLLGSLAGLELLHVAYKGSPPAVADVLGGRVPLMFDALVNSAPLVKGGRLKAYAVSSVQRSRFLPDVPTFHELGYPQLVFSGWIGVFGGEQLPPRLTARINAEIVRELASATVSARLAGLHVDASPPTTPHGLQRLLRADYLRNARMYEAFDLKAD